MQLLRRTHHAWKTDGLNSCSYKILSVHRAPLFINITADIGQPEHAHWAGVLDTEIQETVSIKNPAFTSAWQIQY